MKEFARSSSAELILVFEMPDTIKMVMHRTAEVINSTIESNKWI